MQGKKNKRAEQSGEEKGRDDFKKMENGQAGVESRKAMMTWDGVRGWLRERQKSKLSRHNLPPQTSDLTVTSQASSTRAGQRLLK